MWGLLCCCVTLGIASPLWVQALPANITLDEIDTNHVDIKPSECPENEFFNHEGKACELTCELPIPEDSCDEEKVVACECNEGYVRNEIGVCVTLLQCYDNFDIPYNVKYDASKPKPDEVAVKELTLNLDQIQSTNKTNDTLETTYDVDGYTDLLTDIEVNLIVNFVLDRLSSDEISIILHEIRTRRNSEESIDPERHLQYLYEILKDTLKDELDSSKSSDYHGEDNDLGV